MVAEDKPATYILKLIRKGLSLGDLERLIKDSNTPLPIFMAALQGFERYKKIIDRLQKIQNTTT